jgi:head-tail adaptor
MLSRKYCKRIQIWIPVTDSDGYGGNTVDDFSVGDFWAEVKQLSSSKDTSNGTTYPHRSFSFKIRSTLQVTPGHDLSIIYNGIRYVTSEIKYDDDLFRFTTIIAHA